MVKYEHLTGLCVWGSESKRYRFRISNGSPTTYGYVFSLS